MKKLIFFFAIMLSSQIVFVNSCSGQQAKEEYISDANETDYILALRCANQFLESWKSRNGFEKGYKLLSSKLRNRHTNNEWRHIIEGLSNPYHAAYELGPGKKLQDGRYSFEVLLYTHVFGQRSSEPFKRPKSSSSIILINVGLQEWRVDELMGDFLTR